MSVAGTNIVVTLVRFLTTGSHQVHHVQPWIRGHGRYPVHRLHGVLEGQLQRPREHRVHRVRGRQRRHGRERLLAVCRVRRRELRRGRHHRVHELLCRAGPPGIPFRRLLRISYRDYHTC